MSLYRLGLQYTIKLNSVSFSNYYSIDSSNSKRLSSSKFNNTFVVLGSLNCINNPTLCSDIRSFFMAHFDESFFESHVTMLAKKMLVVIVCQFKKKQKNCNPYFIVIMITVLIMNVIFWVGNFKTQNYFVIYTIQNLYLRFSMYDCSNFVYSCRICGISELQTV
jgi:hypothetical protein